MRSIEISGDTNSPFLIFSLIISASFEPESLSASDNFLEARSECMFTTGSKGLGYYPDDSDNPMAPIVDDCLVSASKTLSLARSPCQESPPKTFAFLTHDWGVNEDGTQNHEIVKKVNQYLKAFMPTWFDDERMTGYVKHKMAEGIDHTQCVVAFVTERYLTKVNSNDINDNCCFEFGHAISQRGNKIIPVLMEDRLRDPNTWFGVGGAAMGRLIYIDMTKHEDPVEFQKGCEQLRDKILGYAA